MKFVYKAYEIFIQSIQNLFSYKDQLPFKCSSGVVMCNTSVANHGGQARPGLYW